MDHKHAPTRKVGAATAGAALGEILSAILVGGFSFEWWPHAPTTVLFAFILGWLVPDKQD